jgi:glucose/arabinose dehydrogenase
MHPREEKVNIQNEYGQFFIDYTRRPDGATVIERYTVSKDNANRADDQSGKVILVIAQPEANHNGGQLQFGPDGYLYIGMGDGGGQGIGTVAMPRLFPMLLSKFKLF